MVPEPVVVAEPAGIAGLAPLHTTDCPVVHVHGDYLAGHLALGAGAYTAACNDVEYLRLLQDAFQRLAEKGPLERALLDQQSLQELRRCGAATPPGEEHVRRAQDLNRLQQDIDARRLERASHAWPRHLPHLFLRLHLGVAGAQVRATASATAGEQLLHLGPAHPLIAAGLAGENSAHLAVAKDAVDLALHQAGEHLHTAQLVRNRAIPSEFWLDDDRTHA